MIKYLLLLMTAAIFSSSCKNAGSSGGHAGELQGASSISGTVTATANVQIGPFSSDYTFDYDFFGAGDEDVVYEEWTAGSTGEFAPLYSVAPDGGGAYALDLPDDPSTMYNVIAWVDTDGDEKFDLGTENGYFCIKSIGGDDYVIDSFGYADFGEYGIYYIISYYDGSTNYIEDLDTVGTSGYDFAID